MSATPTLHFMCGKAGAGKSTVAAALARETGAILLVEDIWMARLYGDQMTVFDDYLRFSRKLKTVIGPLCVDLLRAGHSVVLDFQANTRAGRAWFRSVVEEAGVPHVLHVLDTPDSVCLARIARRNQERPEGSHRLTEEDFRHISSFFQAPDPAEGFHLRVHTAQP
ncbi:MAG: ATP-binding protein [Burkholderiales bacterium]